MSTVGFAGDYTNWDGSLPAQLIMSCADVVNRWYNDSEENQNMRRAIFAEYAFSQFVVLDGIFSKTRGMPSGCVGTSEFNCIINQMVFLMAWKILAKEYQPTVCSMHRYPEFVTSFFYGDDNISAVKQTVPWFNAVNVSRVLSEFGLSLTSEDKEAELRKANVDLGKLTFLKRHFVPLTSCEVLAPMDPDVLREEVMWVRKHLDPHEALLVNVRVSLEEAHMLGEDFFNEHKRILNEALARLKIAPRLETFQGIREEWHRSQANDVAALQGVMWFSTRPASKSSLTLIQCDGSWRNIGLLSAALQGGSLG